MLKVLKGRTCDLFSLNDSERFPRRVYLQNMKRAGGHADRREEGLKSGWNRGWKAPLVQSDSETPL